MDAMKLLGSLMGRNATGGNMLGSLLGGATRGRGGAAGMLGSLLGGGRGGGAAGMLGSLLGGGAAAGGIGAMVSGLMGGGGSAEAAPEAAAIEGNAPTADQATLMIRAMCNAAKADGEVDQEERQNIIGRLGDDVGESEIAFLKEELAAPLDLAGFANSVPAEMAADIYTLSCMTIKVDTPQEAQYLQQLGQAMNLDQQALAGIHKELGLA